MRVMLSSASQESFDLKTLTVDVLKILCEERGINVRESKGTRKQDLIESLKVQKALSPRQLNSCGHR